MDDGDGSNRQLRARLSEAGWSPETFARRITEYGLRQQIPARVHEKTPYHWLRDGRCPHDPVPELAATVLSERLGRSVTPADLGWHPTRSLTRRADDGLAFLWFSGGAIRGLEEVASGMQRRGFLALAGSALTAVAHQWMVLDSQRLAAVLDGGRRIDEALVAQFERLADVRRRMDDALGGGALFEAVTADLRLVVRLLKTGTYSETLGRRLYSVAAEFARLAGWACHEQQAEGAAQRYWIIALRAAHEADDGPLGAYIVMLMGNQAVEMGSPANAVTLMSSALTTRDLGATQQANIMGCLARANGRVGDARAATTHIARSFELLDSARREDDPPWLYWFDHTHLTSRTGQTLLSLGKAALATGHLQSAVSNRDNEQPRAGVWWLTALATAQLRAGDAEQALATAHEAVDLAEPLSSDRMRNALVEFAAEADHNVRNAATRELAERARVTLKS